MQKKHAATRFYDYCSGFFPTGESGGDAAAEAQSGGSGVNTTVIIVAAAVVGVNLLLIVGGVCGWRQLKKRRGSRRDDRPGESDLAQAASGVSAASAGASGQSIASNM